MADLSDFQDFFYAFALVLLGAFSVMIIDAVRSDIAENKCAKAHNVFTCEFHGEWVPVREISQ